MANAVELLLDNIKAGKKETIESLYKDYYFDIESFVINNSGNREEAKDLFQECMYIIFEYSRKPHRKDIESFSAYFSGIYRNRWYSHLKKKKREFEKLEGWNQIEIADTEDLYYYSYLKAFEQLGEDCKKVLRYYINAKTTEEIAELINTSIDYAKRKKYLCKEKLKEIAHRELKKNE